MLAQPAQAPADLHTVKAPTMAAALAEVKKSLGPGAVIHRTRTFREGALLGLGGRQVVEIVASREAPNILSSAERRARATAAAGDATGVLHAAASARRASPRPRPSPEPAPAPDPMTSSMPRPSLPAAEHPAPISVSTAALATPVRLAPQDATAASDLEAELGAIKRMLGQVLRTTRRVAPTALGGLPEPVARLHQGLLDADCPAQLAADVAERVAAQLSEPETQDPHILLETAARALEPSIRTVGPAPRSVADADRARRVALVGPTGVGKTTTIAKLAATAALRQGRRVGLITTDTYRIAAVEQLRTYASIIGLPLEVAQTPDEVLSAASALDACDVVFIDTAGRSHADGDRLAELSDMLSACRPDEIHLVLSAAASPSTWRRVAERFGRFGADRVILTKLDECAAPGVIFALDDHVALPISYITDGQDVPDHVEPARPERLARTIVRAALAEERG